MIITKQEKEPLVFGPKVPSILIIINQLLWKPLGSCYGSACCFLSLFSFSRAQVSTAAISAVDEGEKRRGKRGVITDINITSGHQLPRPATTINAPIMFHWNQVNITTTPSFSSLLSPSSESSSSSHQILKRQWNNWATQTKRQTRSVKHEIKRSRHEIWLGSHNSAIILAHPTRIKFESNPSIRPTISIESHRLDAVNAANIRRDAIKIQFDSSQVNTRPAEMALECGQQNAAIPIHLMLIIWR